MNGILNEQERALFNEWFRELMVTCESCLLRDILRNQKENLWAEWLKVNPYGANE